MIRPLLAALAMAAAVWLLRRQFNLAAETPAYLAMLVACAAAGALTYGAALYALWRAARCPPGPEHLLFAKFQAALARLGVRLKLLP